MSNIPIYTLSLMRLEILKSFWKLQSLDRALCEYYIVSNIALVDWNGQWRAPTYIFAAYKLFAVGSLRLETLMLYLICMWCNIFTHKFWLVVATQNDAVFQALELNLNSMV